MFWFVIGIIGMANLRTGCWTAMSTVLDTLNPVSMVSTGFSVKISPNSSTRAAFPLSLILPNKLLQISETERSPLRAAGGSGSPQNPTPLASTVCLTESLPTEELEVDPVLVSVVWP